MLNLFTHPTAGRTCTRGQPNKTRSHATRTRVFTRRSPLIETQPTLLAFEVREIEMAFNGVKYLTNINSSTQKKTVNNSIACNRGKKQTIFTPIR